MVSILIIFGITNKKINNRFVSLLTLFCRVLEDRKSHYEPSITGAPAQIEELDEHDLYVPHFQRVSISGEDTSGVSSFCFP